MKTLSGALFLFSLFSNLALGDGGIPVDRSTNQVTTPHVMLTISESQQEEIETMGTLTLSSEQWQSLRTISGRCPKRIEQIVPSTYRDCGCGLIGIFYGIQMSVNQVAVPHYELSGSPESADLPSALSSKSSLVLHMDRRGQFFYGGALIPFGDLLKLVAIPGKENRDLGVVRPFGMKRNSAVAKDRLDTLYKAAAVAGWKEWDLALDEN